MTPISAEALPEFAVGRDVLAIPSRHDIVALAESRYPQVSWKITPEEAASSQQSTRNVGARFRGMASAAEQVQPQLAVSGAVVLTGPTPLGSAAAQRCGLVATGHDLYVLPDVVGDDLTQMRSWALAVARYTGGGILQSDGTSLRPDPEANVDLRLFSPDPQPMEGVLDVLRPVLPRARTFRLDDGSSGIFVELEYDGAIVATQTRATREVPLTLKNVDWREYGPHIYTMSWVPPQPAELGAAEPSQLHLIARRRAAPLVARSVQQLQKALSGTVLDADDFMVTAEALKDRAMGRHTAR